MPDARSRIRNFSVIAHVDHGKTTLSDRILELTGTVALREMREQLLDSMDLEREKGITIKARAVRMAWTVGGEPYELNLIDTPGHVDFNYEVIPVINKVDLPNIDIDLVREDLRTTLGFKDEEILLASGKTGQGVAEILNAVVARVHPPSGDPDAPLRALIFDSHYDAYKGVVAHVRVVDGAVEQGDRILLMATHKESELLELGVFAPNAVPIKRLAT